MATYNELLKQKEELDAMIREARKTEVSQAVQKVKQLITEHGLTAADCGFGKPQAKASVKYRGPNGEAWSGRGRTPVWLRNAEDAGQSRQSFLAH